MLTGTRPFSGLPLPFCLPAIATRPIVFINRRGIIGLVGFAVPHNPIRASLDRFRVGLMAEILARENFKSTKTSKTSQTNPFKTKRRVVGKGRFSLVDFLPEVRKYF
jgi:hypothetical protein